MCDSSGPTPFGGVFWKWSNTCGDKGDKPKDADVICALGDANLRTWFLSGRSAPHHIWLKIMLKSWARARTVSMAAYTLVHCEIGDLFCFCCCCFCKCWTVSNIKNRLFLLLYIFNHCVIKQNKRRKEARLEYRAWRWRATFRLSEEAATL